MITSWDAIVSCYRRKLHRFLLLPLAERRLLIRAVVLVCFVRVGLSLLRFQTLWEVLGKLPRQGPDNVSRGVRLTYQDYHAYTIAFERIAVAVRRASRLVPKATCLTQALAMEAMLTRQGYPALVRIGAAKATEHSLEAHAWVELDGLVFNGAGDRYTPLLSLQREQP